MDNRQTDPIRKSVASGDFQSALRLWNVYAAAIGEEICRGTCTKDRIAEVREFMEWVRPAVLCARAHAQAQLNTIHVSELYSQEAPPQSSFLRARL